MDYLKSPLRYPGGKSRAVKEITKYFPKAEEYVFPFTGGASIELFTFQNLSKNIKCYDVFQPLINFWNSLSNHNDEMIEHITDIGEEDNHFGSVQPFEYEVCGTSPTGIADECQCIFEHAIIFPCHGVP